MIMIIFLPSARANERRRAANGNLFQRGFIFFGGLWLRPKRAGLARVHWAHLTAKGHWMPRWGKSTTHIIYLSYGFLFFLAPSFKVCRAPLARAVAPQLSEFGHRAGGQCAGTPGSTVHQSRYNPVLISFLLIDALLVFFMFALSANYTDASH